MLRILKECQGSDTVADAVAVSDVVGSAVAPDLWHNREVLLALSRCCSLHPPMGSLDQFDSDEDLWLQMAGAKDLEAFASFCPSKFRQDRTFLISALRANPGRCLGFLTEELPLDLDLIWQPAPSTRSSLTLCWTVAPPFSMMRTKM